MTNDRDRAPSVPPSIAPGAARPRPGAADGQPIVVGRGAASPAGPTVPPAQPASAAAPSRPAPPRVSARPGGSARPVPPPAPPDPPAAIPPRRVASARTSGYAPGARPTSGPGAVRPAAVRPTSPAAPSSRPAGAPPAVPPPTAARRRRGRAVAGVLVVLVVLALAWPVGLAVWANGRLGHVDALSGAPGTPGTTYLLAGSDERPADEPDGTEGARSDTILLLHVPAHGPAALISLPRDSYVDIPGHDANKLNWSYAVGGPALLVSTVEELTGMTVDHYVEVGFGGVEGVVDALGGVELCSDLDVVDEMSGLVWTPGCQVADGALALRFARMRYSDPTGDIGRGERQRQVIQKITKSAASAQTLVNPGRQVRLVRAGTDALTVDESANVLTLARVALAFRSATGPGGITGTPPLASLNHSVDGVGSTVLLDPDATPVFFAQIAAGELPPGTVGGVPAG